MIKKIKSFFTLPFYPNPCPPRIQPQIFHSRTQTGQEVDIVLEGPKGWLVGIEVKTAAVVGSVMHRKNPGRQTLIELFKGVFPS
jgi:predicted AAA+ superfamily ATPase